MRNTATSYTPGDTYALRTPLIDRGTTNCDVCVSVAIPVQSSDTLSP